MEVLFVLDHAVNFTLGMKGNISGDGGTTTTVYGSNLSIINPNPGNGTHLTNYLKSDVSGLTCSVDVSCINFTTPPGSEWGHIVNLTWYSNSSGVWLPFYVSLVDGNGTVTVPAVNFSGIGVYYWNVSWESNHTNYGNSSVWSFETVNTSGGGYGMASSIGMDIVVGGFSGFIIMVCIGVYWWRKNDEVEQRR
jgi:hypothetical protein